MCCLLAEKMQIKRAGMQERVNKETNMSNKSHKKEKTEANREGKDDLSSEESGGCGTSSSCDIFFT